MKSGVGEQDTDVILKWDILKINLLNTIVCQRGQ